MGVISRMRDISPYLLVLFVISFIAFMVISDSSISTVFNSSTTAANAVVGVINGESIPYQEFELRVKEQAELQTQQNPQAEVDENQIRQSVWDQYVEEILIKQSANKLIDGLETDKKELMTIEKPTKFQPIQLPENRVEVKTQAEFNALKSGQKFIFDGRAGTK